MKSNQLRRLAAVSLFALAPLCAANELDDYIAKEDGALAYKIHDEFEIYGARVVNVRLTSQKWRGIEWKHWLTVVLPPKIDPHGKGVLIVAGGSSKGKVPSADAKSVWMVATSALQLRAPVAIIGQVPNQPLFGGLKEDDLIAHTFKNYLDSGEGDWPALLPMTKSATRAMDALAALSKEGKLNPPGGGDLSWDKFIVSGASKRGWTTYLTAAVDKRVIAMAPMVIDVLNMSAQMENQLKTYGGFSDMIKPYTARGIQKRSKTPEGIKLDSIVDPYAYRSRYTMPKLVMLGTNDPYWTVDSSGFYFGDLPSPKSLFYLPNTGHGLGLNALKTGNAFFAVQLDGKPFPELFHHVAKSVWNVTWERAHTNAQFWSASSPDRDFRDAEWTPQDLEVYESIGVGGRVHHSSTTLAKLTPPVTGYSAHFVRVTFPGPREGMSEFHLATSIKVLPETFPHPLPE